MNDQVRAALIAVLFGSILAAVLLAPAVAISYRRRGHAGGAWLLGWFALLIQAVSLWSYTLLPIPTTDSIVCVGRNLTLLGSLDDVRAHPTGSLAELIQNPALAQLVLNVALFVPLGILLRAMFDRGVVTAVVVGFSISLAIETTQLTGVWGLFECAYRVFDVDDLVTNTLGALAGSLAALVVWRPGRPRRDPSTPQPVTAFRRLLGMACDLLVVVLPVVVIQALWRLGLHVVGGVAYVDMSDAEGTAVAWSVVALTHLAWVLATGSTLGESAVMLRCEPRRHGVVTTRLLRYVGGIGGVILAARLLPGGVGLGALVVVHAAALLRTRDHRGLAGWIAGAELVDSRAARARQLADVPG